MAKDYVIVFNSHQNALYRIFQHTYTHTIDSLVPKDNGLYAMVEIMRNSAVVVVVFSIIIIIEKNVCKHKQTFKMTWWNKVAEQGEEERRAEKIAKNENNEVM